MAQKNDRFVVRLAPFGGSVIDTHRSALTIAWCGDTSRTSADDGTVSIDGRAEAQRIARLLNDAEAAKGKR